MYARIRNLREDADLAESQLLNCTQVCYSNYEMGKRDIPTDVLIKLANFYHTSIDYLLGETDVRVPTRKITNKYAKSLCPSDRGFFYQI